MGRITCCPSKAASAVFISIALASLPLLPGNVPAREAHAATVFVGGGEIANSAKTPNALPIGNLSAVTGNRPANWSAEPANDKQTALSNDTAGKQPKGRQAVSPQANHVDRPAQSPDMGVSDQSAISPGSLPQGRLAVPPSAQSANQPIASGTSAQPSKAWAVPPATPHATPPTTGTVPTNRETAPPAAGTTPPLQSPTAAPGKDAAPGTWAVPPATPDATPPSTGTVPMKQETVTPSAGTTPPLPSPAAAPGKDAAPGTWAVPPATPHAAPPTTGTVPTNQETATPAAGTPPPLPSSTAVPGKDAAPGTWVVPPAAPDATPPSTGTVPMKQETAPPTTDAAAPPTNPDATPGTKTPPTGTWAVPPAAPHAAPPSTGTVPTKQETATPGKTSSSNILSVPQTQSGSATHKADEGIFPTAVGQPAAETIATPITKPFAASPDPGDILPVDGNSPSWTYERFLQACAQSGRDLQIGSKTFATLMARKAKSIAQVEHYLASRFGRADPAVVAAFAKVPREYFHYNYQHQISTAANAYEPSPKPWGIGYGSALSDLLGQSYMTQLAAPKPDDVVLEIGTGSGYQIALLSRLVKEAYSIEIIAPLGERTKEIFRPLGYTNVHTRVGDGYFGWPEVKEGFDIIMLTCAASYVSPELLKQLKPGGRLIVPIGQPFKRGQFLYVFTRDTEGKIHSRKDSGVYFIPMTGYLQTKSPPQGTPGESSSPGRRAAAPEPRQARILDTATAESR
ncbi:MAG: hypothetical protein LBR22_05890 [Desulfovibrio sp.]|jgi:protein-L-isoaspartate(D-aspartate) O-methyltransferase|nr:hypothetical protein [Desulfovibrio sp.]